MTTTSVQILITLILTAIAVLVGGFSLWINWKNYRKNAKETKDQLQNQIKQKLKNSFEKINYHFLDQENLHELIDKNGDQDVFYRKYYQIFLKWQKWKKIKEWKPHYFNFNSFIRHYTKILINGSQREIDLIETEGQIGFDWENDKSKIFWQFYFAFKKFLEKFFSIGFDMRDYEKNKLNDYSKIFFSEKICKILNQIINYGYK